VKRRWATCTLVALLGCQRAEMEVGKGPALGLPPLPAAAAASPAMVDLGRKLFMDRRLSRNGTMACAMCHVPEQGFAAVELSTSIGIEGRTLRRNAPTLLNVAYVGQLFHDGRSASLESQAWDPLLNPIEMGNPDPHDVIDKIRSLPDYAGRFETAFGGAAPDRANVAAALASFQRTLVSGNSRFDRWHYAKDETALNSVERAGFALFAGKGRCIACHTVGERNALFSDGRFHNTGIGAARQRAASDPDRRIEVMLAPGVMTEMGERELANVSEPVQADEGRFEVTKKDADRWSYRTPSLRNVAITGPYMHDGSLATLEAVIDFYQRGGIDNPGKSPLLQPLELSEDEKRSLTAFLRTLTGANAVDLARQARTK
jgi:cytochrome c peroxidase